MSTSLALPSKFHATALAFPDKVKAAIAAMDTPEKAVDALAQARAISEYAKAVKATTGDKNAITYGFMLLAAKVGELAGDERGRPKKGQKKNRAATDVFHRDTLSSYRKLAKHQQNRPPGSPTAATKPPGPAWNTSAATGRQAATWGLLRGVKLGKGSCPPAARLAWAEQANGL